MKSTYKPVYFKVEPELKAEFVKTCEEMKVDMTTILTAAMINFIQLSKKTK